MKEYVLNICYYLIISSILFNLFPDEKYLKYIKLFSGFILIMILMRPLVDFFDKGYQFDKIDDDFALEIEMEELEEDIGEYESVIEERIKEIETAQ